MNKIKKKKIIQIQKTYKYLNIRNNLKIKKRNKYLMIVQIKTYSNQYLARIKIVYLT